MSRSLIQVVNPTTQAVADGGIISLGSVSRRFGCNLRLSGNAIECAGEGYYTIECDVAVEPLAAGNVTVALYNNGVPLPGAVAYGSIAVEGENVTLPVQSTIRQGCNCCDADSITAVLVEGAGTVKNIAMRIEKV